MGFLEIDLMLGPGFARNSTEKFPKMIATCRYSEGVVSHSPGLPRFAATLGASHNDVIYPEGVASMSINE